MILQALTGYYEALLKKGEDVAQFGWEKLSASIGLELNDSGEIVGSYVLTHLIQGKMIAPSAMLPQRLRNTSERRANFLCDHPGYLLGMPIHRGKKNIDVETEESKAKEREEGGSLFALSSELHLNVLKSVSSPAASAVKNFFSSWNHSSIFNHSVIQPLQKELEKKPKLVFFHRQRPVHEDSLIQAAWSDYFQSIQSEVIRACLITGQSKPVAKVHPAIAKIGGTQPKVVSFNKTSFCSYGHDSEGNQHLNAATSAYAAFAYTTALNYLLSDTNSRIWISDTAIATWAIDSESDYQEIFNMGMMGGFRNISDSVIRVLSLLQKGQTVQWNGTDVDPHTMFYIMGIRAQKGRVMVQFFLENTFGTLLKGLSRYYDSVEIQRPAWAADQIINPSQLLQLITRQPANSDSREYPHPSHANAIFTSILLNKHYPPYLIYAINQRIRSAQDEKSIKTGRRTVKKLTWEQAAIVKAYYLRNPHPLCPKEVLTVSLHEESRNIPYTLGRLFSVLESIQEKANPGINTTIKDRYFNSASSTPSTVFPLLIKLSQKHLRKLDEGLKIYYNKQTQLLMEIFDQELPLRLTLPEQGAFQLGYYHQTQQKYNKSEEE